MIVIDEQLQGEGLEENIGKWYPGAVVSVTSLRPNSIIKDDAIPILLAQQKHPVFITINVNDFWQRIPLSNKFCVVCFDLTTSDIHQIPDLLRRLLRHAQFNKRSQRTGKVVRISKQESASFYSVSNSMVRSVVGF